MTKKAPKRAKPVPLTTTQLQTEAGQELLELAESITEDGLVSPDEVTRLHRWLHRHADEGLPAVDFLNGEVDQLREDEKAGDTWPRRRLHRALERVLPKALRVKATAQRKDAEALEFSWGVTADDPPAAEPAMRANAPTLLLPVPEVPLVRLRAAVAARVARGEMTERDVLRDLSDPPKPPKKSKDGKKKASKKVEPKQPAESTVRVENMPSPDPVARVRPPSDATARSRYRGELMWFDGRAWAVFTDPDDADCRYAQPVE